MTAGLVIAWLAWLVGRLGRSRPDLGLALPLAAGAAVRVVAVVALSALAPDARGPDEQAFLQEARILLDLPLGSPESLQALTSTFQVWLFSMELRIPGFPELAMRLLQVGFSLTGLVLVAVSVHDLAGPRAGRIAAWAIMLEPSSVFFSGLLHKEPFMLLGAGIVVFGATRVWRHRDLTGVLTMAFGVTLTTFARPYAGAILGAGALATCFHGALTRRGPLQQRSLGLAAVLLVVVVAATPTILQQTSDQRLQSKLQISQNANSTDFNANLRLEPVDFSSRTQVLLNLPKRMRDLVLRPYPWELGSANQRAGLPGTLSALVAFALLAVAVARRRTQVLERAGPILYPAGALFLAFSLSAGNAGTSFRLRSTVVVLVLATAVVLLRERRQETLATRHRRAPAMGRPSRAPRPASIAIARR